MYYKYQLDDELENKFSTSPAAYNRMSSCESKYHVFAQAK